jgi:large subunit ribosomal protein L21
MRSKTMYAVIETGGKQYRVEPGDTVVVEKLPGAAGDAVEFEQVLLLSDDQNVAVGRPLVQGAKVTGKIVEQGRDDKIIVYKFQRRKDYRRKYGHRQAYTAVHINDVVIPS